MPRYPFAFSCLALLARLCVAGETADFLVLESPASLEILNRYEQPLASREKAALPAFAPLRVVQEETLLGDGITSAKEVRFDGHPYYLLRSGGAGDPPGSRRYRGGKVLDGPETAAGAELSCAQGVKPGGRPKKLRKGQAVQPVFSHGAHAYVKIPGIRAEYAWCPSGGPFVGKEKAGRESAGQGPGSNAPASGLDPSLQSLLGRRMESANAAYAAYTGAFNRLTGESRQPPRWECSISTDGMACTLAGDLRAEDLAKSTAVLLEDLRTNLAGRPFAVSFANGELIISPRTGPSRAGKDSRAP